MTWRWEVLVDWLRDVDPRLGAEIGVKKGKFTSYLLNAYPKLMMHVVDPWENQPGANEDYTEWNWIKIYNEYFENIKTVRDRIIEHRDYSKNVAPMIPDGQLDFVFIDAQHDYISVRQDIELWGPKIRKGGLLAGHDYQSRFPGVIAAVNEKFNPMLGSDTVWAVKM